MFRVTTDWEHIHTDSSWDGLRVLEKARASLAHLSARRTVLVDVIETHRSCKCSNISPGKTWMILIYHLEDVSSNIRHEE